MSHTEFDKVIERGSVEETLLDQIDLDRLPTHVAIIMDGNGRWAQSRKLPRVEGHRAGIASVRETVETCARLGIKVLTLYAFSEENWQRPAAEVRALMKLLNRFLKTELEEMQHNGICLKAIGRIERLPKETGKILLETIEKTSSNEEMVLTLALSYGGRQEILDGIRKIAIQIENREKTAKDVSEKLISDSLYTAGIPDPDLLIRTSGEYRISNFLLWQISYSEFYFTPTLWPDFDKEEYLRAIETYQKRERRFGCAGTKA